MDEFSNLIHGKKDEERFKLINAVGGQSLRVMKKLGMRDEIDRFHTRLHSEILRGTSTAELEEEARQQTRGVVGCAADLTESGGRVAVVWSVRTGRADHSRRAERAARPQAVKLEPKDYTPLARSYVAALGQGPSETGMARITELFRKMDEKKINNTWTTAQYYSRFHLNLVEDVIQAIVSDEFALGPGGRKWLDDDEYIVRRRIHADMKHERERYGL